MQWLMLQQEKPKDYVIATGKQFSVRQFVEWSAQELGIELRFDGQGVNEVGIVEAVTGSHVSHVNKGSVIVRVDPRYFRPAEVETLLGDATLAEKDLGWLPQISVQDMCREMVKSDLDEAISRRREIDFQKSRLS
jgi:GDPmannose 4,6-dehydratase